MKISKRLITAVAMGAVLAAGATALRAAEMIPVALLSPETGIVGFAGQEINKGATLAVEMLNESGRLGDYKIELTIKDTGSKPATAAALASQAARSGAIAIIGPALSSAALAVAPIAQREKLPMIAVQANTQGVVEAGEYVYRLTAPFYTFNRLTFNYLKKIGVKKVAMTYLSNIPSVAGLGRDFAPVWAKDAGIEVVANEPTPFATTDFSTVIAKLVASNPDAIGLFLIDTQLPAVIAGVRRAGFKGQLFVYNISPGTLDAVGDAADGIVLSIDYSPALTYPSSVTFTEAYRKKYNTEPVVYSANGYDAVLFLATALEKIVKAGEKPDRESLLKALAGVAETGFKGATGQINFDSTLKRDARVGGALVKYVGGKPKLILTGDPSLDTQ